MLNLVISIGCINWLSGEILNTVGAKFWFIIA